MTKWKRNYEIAELLARRIRQIDIAKRFNLSRQRVHQIYKNNKDLIDYIQDMEDMEDMEQPDEG